MGVMLGLLWEDWGSHKSPPFVTAENLELKGLKLVRLSLLPEVHAKARLAGGGAAAGGTRARLMV